MAPPNFSRNKKRKSRSRGSSAGRRAKPKIRSSHSTCPLGSRDESAGTSADTCNLSEQTTDSVNSNIGSKNTFGGISKCKKVSKESFKKDRTHVAISAKSSNDDRGFLLTLANEIATDAIVKAGSTLKHSETSSPSHSNQSSNMVLTVDEKLNSLSKLLERLDTQYRSSGRCFSGGTSPQKEPAVNCNSTETSFSHIASNCIDASTVDGKCMDEKTQTQEEKQAIRKEKKEAKKKGKATKLDANEELPKSELKKMRKGKQETQSATKFIEKEKELKLKQESLPNNVEQTSQRKKKEISSSSALPVKQLPLLGHLARSIEQIDRTTIHPAVRAIGLSMKDRFIDGCTTRVLATLSAICALIEDYSTPSSCDLPRDLSHQLDLNVSYLNSCRPIPQPMNNAIRYVKMEINNVDPSMLEIKAKEELLSAIQIYVDQNISLASKTIINNALEVIEKGDVVLTYGYSSLVLETLRAAALHRENLSVVVVDNGSSTTGMNILSSLSELGVKLFYRIIPDISDIMTRVTKVLVEAEALVLNGAVMALCGTAGVALSAFTHSIPFIVLSHTYKFCNIDLSDSFVVNELAAAPEEAMSGLTVALMKDCQTLPTLNVVSLVYDVTPPYMVSLLVTERNVAPTTVVPTIIKRNFADILSQD